MRTLMMIAALAASAPAHAEMAEGPIVEGWHIHSLTDTMSDELKCAAYYEDNSYISLKPTEFHVFYTGRGGLKSYRYRYDDEKPHAVGWSGGKAATWTGRWFKELMEAKRLRIQALTLLSSMIEEDVDLTGAPAAIAEMKAMGCADRW